MQLPRPSDYRIRLISVSPRRDMLRHALRELGLVVIDEAADGAMADAVLVDLMSGMSPSHTSTNDTACRIAFGPGQPPEDTELHLTRVEQLPDLPRLLNELRRAEIRATETRLRQMTHADFGRTAPARLSVPLHVLLAARPDPQLLPLQSALRQRGARVTASFTGATLDQYLSATPFSACLIDLSAASSIVPAFLRSRMSDPRVAALPCLGFNGPVPTSLGADDRACFDRILSLGETAETVADTVTRLARFPAIERMPRETDPATDRITGLPSRLFFERHLERQITMTRGEDLPHALIAFRLLSQANPAIQSVARSIAGYIRAEDMACRIDWRTILVSVRASDYTTSMRLAERVLGCLSRDGIDVSAFGYKVVELRRSHSAERLIDAATLGPFMGQAAA